MSQHIDQSKKHTRLERAARMLLLYETEQRILNDDAIAACAVAVSKHGGIALYDSGNCANVAEAIGLKAVSVLHYLPSCNDPKMGVEDEWAGPLPKTRRALWEQVVVGIVNCNNENVFKLVKAIFKMENLAPLEKSELVEAIKSKLISHSSCFNREYLIRHLVRVLTASKDSSSSVGFRTILHYVTKNATGNDFSELIAFK